MEDRLKPCPMCGGVAGLYHDYKGFAIVQCNKCSIGTLYRPSKKVAVTEWNTRKPMDRIVEQLEEESALMIETGDAAIYAGVQRAIEIVKAGGKNE